MDATTFDRFYESAFGRLVGQIYALCGDFTEAQDCVQEAFIRAWQQRAKLDQNRGPEAWVRLTAHRLAISRWRRKERFPVQEAVDLVGRIENPNPARVALVKALQTLPDNQRHALVMHYIADLSIADIAAETGTPEGTIKARLFRGRTALAQLLHDEEGYHA